MSETLCKSSRGGTTRNSRMHVFISSARAHFLILDFPLNKIPTSGPFPLSHCHLSSLGEREEQREERCKIQPASYTAMPAKSAPFLFLSPPSPLHVTGPYYRRARRRRRKDLRMGTISSPPAAGRYQCRAYHKLPQNIPQAWSQHSYRRVQESQFAS